jgi:hypothetical protein
VIGGLALAVLVVLAGGPIAMLKKPGVVVPSQAFLLAIGRLPLVAIVYPRLAGRSHLSRLVAGYGVCYSVVVLSNSRILFTFEVLSLAALWLWNSPTRRSLLTGAIALGIVTFIVFFGYGTYRERASNPTSQVSVFSPGPAIDWFYGKNVEAGAGIAGAMSRRIPSPDFGAGTVSGSAVQLLPGPVRSALGLRPPKSVSASVVPSAIEDAFLAARFVGIALLGALVGGLGAAIDYFGRRPESRAAAAALAPFSLLLVRGSLRDAIVFGVSQILLMALVRNVSNRRYTSQAFA